MFYDILSIACQEPNIFFLIYDDQSPAANYAYFRQIPLFEIYVNLASYYTKIQIRMYNDIVYKIIAYSSVHSISALCRLVFAATV